MQRRHIYDGRWRSRRALIAEVALNAMCVSNLTTATCLSELRRVASTKVVCDRPGPGRSLV